MEVAYRKYNQEQLDEKLNRQAFERKLDEEERLNQIEYISGNDFFTENTVLISFYFRTHANLNWEEIE